MTYQIENNRGYPVLRIRDDCEYSEFYKFAEFIENKFKIEFYKKLNDVDSLYWDFTYENANLTLHYHVFFGLSISPTAVEGFTTTDEIVVNKLASIFNASKDL